MTNFAQLLYYPTFIGNQAKEIVNWDRWSAGFTFFNIIDAASTKLSGHLPENSYEHSTRSKVLEFVKDMWMVPASLATLGTVVQTISLMTRQFSILPEIEQNGDDNVIIPYDAYAIGFNVVVWIGAVGTAYMVYKTTKAVNDHFWKDRDAGELVEGIPSNQLISYCHPPQEFLEESFLVTRIACGVAILAMDPMSPLNTLSLASQSYTLIKIAQRQWIKFQIEVPAHYDGIKTIICKIFLKIHPMPIDDTFENQEQCPICLDSIESQALPISNTVLFCERHPIHLQCLSTNVMHNLDKLEKGFCKPLIMENHTNEFFGFFGKKIIYTTELDMEKLPYCQMCKYQPKYALEGELITEKNERYPLNIIVKKFAP
jgi:hypothetical protein